MLRRIAVLIAICAGAASADTLFEVASVRPAIPGGVFAMSGGPGTSDPGLVRYANTTLKSIIRTAYALSRYQVIGPAWLDTERYTIIAKVPVNTTKEQFRLMLQNLLSDRFGPKVRYEQKDLMVYWLVLGKSGPRMTETSGAGAGEHNTDDKVSIKDGFIQAPGRMGHAVIPGRKTPYTCPLRG